MELSAWVMRLVPQKVDPLTPSASLLKDLSVIAQIHTNPGKARETVGRCENLRTALTTYPNHPFGSVLDFPKWGKARHFIFDLCANTFSSKQRHTD